MLGRFICVLRYRNGILLRQTDRTKMETLSDGTCTLTVNECTMSDEGIYRCEAENKLGRAKTQCTAHVQCLFFCIFSMCRHILFIRKIDI